MKGTLIFKVLYILCYFNLPASGTFGSVGQFANYEDAAGGQFGKLNGRIKILIIPYTFLAKPNSGESRNVGGNIKTSNLAEVGIGNRIPVNFGNMGYEGNGGIKYGFLLNENIQELLRSVSNANVNDKKEFFQNVNYNGINEPSDFMMHKDEAFRNGNFIDHKIKKNNGKEIDHDVGQVLFGFNNVKKVNTGSHFVGDFAGLKNKKIQNDFRGGYDGADVDFYHGNQKANNIGNFDTFGLENWKSLGEGSHSRGFSRLYGINGIPRSYERVFGDGSNHKIKQNYNTRISGLEGQGNWEEGFRKGIFQDGLVHKLNWNGGFQSGGYQDGKIDLGNWKGGFRSRNYHDEVVPQENQKIVFGVNHSTRFKEFRNQTSSLENLKNNHFGIFGEHEYPGSGTGTYREKRKEQQRFLGQTTGMFGARKRSFGRGYTKKNVENHRRGRTETDIDNEPSGSNTNAKTMDLNSPFPGMGSHNTSIGFKEKAIGNLVNTIKVEQPK